jgi:Ca-activated chloride channel family protein
MSADGSTQDSGSHQTANVEVTLEALRDQRHIRPTDSHRHIAFVLRVTRSTSGEDRKPLTLALVVDRSGSMSGEPLATAKRTAITLADQLTEMDRIALVVFDDKIDVLQQLTSGTPETKANIRAALRDLRARGSTALHAGWLTGCDEIKVGREQGDIGGIARCLLLTDGQANVGEQDPEQIATQAADIQERWGVGTSTFGFGAHYNEHLLGPMAVAGSGQFYHIDTPKDITRAFSAEFTDMVMAAAIHTRLEFEVEPGMTVDVMSAYRQSDTSAQPSHYVIGIGELLAGEERPVVVRFGFPHEDRAFAYTVRARVIWSDGQQEWRSDWQEARFTHDLGAESASELYDPAAMHWIGLAYADRAVRIALEYYKHGEQALAVDFLAKTIEHLERYAGNDADLRAAIQEMIELKEHVGETSVSLMEAKQMYFRSQTRSRGKSDYRRQ